MSEPASDDAVSGSDNAGESLLENDVVVSLLFVVGLLGLVTVLVLLWPSACDHYVHWCRDLRDMGRRMLAKPGRETTDKLNDLNSGGGYGHGHGHGGGGDMYQRALPDIPSAEAVILEARPADVHHLPPAHAAATATADTAGQAQDPRGRLVLLINSSLGVTTKPLPFSRMPSLHTY